MGKPANVNDAREMLLLQIGEEQNICTGICVIDVTGGKVVSGFEVSRVGMKGGSKEVEDYLESGLWKGKAGSFGIRDEGGMEVELIVGEEDNVMGFPGRLALRLLDLVGFDYPDETPSGGG
jgi:septum formation protein